MFNFIIAGDREAWDSGKNGGFFSLSRSRYLEHTNKDIADKFRDLSFHQVETIKNIPCLFGYDSLIAPFYVGKIKNIKLSANLSQIRIEYEIDVSIKPIDYDVIKNLSAALDIRDWELQRTHWAIKDEDLIDVLSRVISTDEVKGISIRNITKEEVPDLKDDSVVVNSVDGFIREVLEVSKNEGMEVFYRGHSRKNKYLLEPSLFRKDESGIYNHLNSEGTIYRELLLSNSIDFRDDKYTLDKLVRAQHYSLPTRLLDITSNPLIGLFFAASSNMEKQGEVISLSVQKEKIKYFDSDTVSCIANLANLSKEDKKKIDFTLSGEKFNDLECIKRLVHFIKEEKPYFENRINPEDLKSVVCVKGKHTNSRISFQSGAFLIYGHEASLPEDGNEQIKIKRITIDNKSLILNQLDKLNINERTVYPSIDNSAKYIAKNFKNKF